MLPIDTIISIVYCSTDYGGLLVNQPLFASFPSKPWLIYRAHGCRAVCVRERRVPFYLHLTSQFLSGHFAPSLRT